MTYGLQSAKSGAGQRKVQRVPDFFKTKKFIVIASVSILIVAIGIIIFLFRPHVEYEIRETAQLDAQAPRFIDQIELLADSRWRSARSIEVLTNGEQFYEAEFDAIANAQHSINLEAYIFAMGTVGDRFRDALTERARNGVRVKILLDAVGSSGIDDDYFDELKAAGGQVVYYHAPRWYTLDRLNNRTHRELVIVDRSIGFVGGAGIGDQWLLPQGEKPRWRDAMFRVTGDAVAGLQAVFIENWLEASGELLNPDEYLQLDGQGGELSALIVRSTPSAGGSTTARTLFQTLIASAKKRLHITNPYFIPDASLQEELMKAVLDRGVDVKIITPGANNDHILAQAASQSRYGELLKAGVEIFEYQPGMNHTKSMLVDDDWVVVGTTNFDSRSFGLNDEVNLVSRNAALATRLQQDFQTDLSNSHRVVYEEWQKRPVWRRVLEWCGNLIARQQ